MYCTGPRYDRNAVHIGLGSLGAGERVRGGFEIEGPRGTSLSELCADTLFRIQNREACGQDIDPGTRTTIPQPRTPAPAPPPPDPVVVVDPAPLPYDPTPGVITSTGSDSFGAPAVTPSAPGGGGGGSWFLPAPAPTSPGDVRVDVQAPEAPERGFGIVEAAVGAVVAYLMARAWGG